MASPLVSVTFNQRFKVTTPFISHTEPETVRNERTGRNEVRQKRVELDTGPEYVAKASSADPVVKAGESMQVTPELAKILEKAGVVGAGRVPGFTTLDTTTGDVKRVPYSADNPMPDAAKKALKAELADTANPPTAERRTIIEAALKAS